MTQLLGSPPILPKTKANERLLNVLQDIVSKVEVDSGFSIRHPDYEPLELPSHTVEHFRQMPSEIQQKYLSLQLRGFLYGTYYNGSMQSNLGTKDEAQHLPLDLENDTFLGVDWEFYNRLHESNNGTGYFKPGWYVLREETDGSLAVTKKGLRLHIQRNKHLHESERTAIVEDTVAIHMPSNLVQNGFYMSVGNMGSSHADDLEHNPILVRVYFNLTPEGAVGVMGSLTRCLNDLAIPFSFKVLYNPKDYKRHDSGVLYFDKRNYQEVREVLQTVYRDNQPHFKPDIPLFTKRLALGLGLAEEPDQKFAELESFGMNRCQIIANGLMEAKNQGDNSPEARMEAIYQNFSLLNIDLNSPYLNANSEDIYAPLNL